MAGSLPISVIIPTYNEEKYIRNVLDGLRDQNFRDFEIIVADWNSTDSTRRIAEQYGARVVPVEAKGIGKARNKGAAAARGKVHVFLDADTRPRSGLLQAYNEAFKANHIVAATGPILPLEKTNRRINFGYKFVSIFFVKLSILFGQPSIVGSNFAVRSDAFKRVGGFDERYLTYEDYDLSLRLRKEGKISYINGAVVHASTRRVKEWGVFGYFAYHTGNMLRYHLLKKPKEEYAPIR